MLISTPEVRRVTGANVCRPVDRVRSGPIHVALAQCGKLLDINTAFIFDLICIRVDMIIVSDRSLVM